MGILSWIIVGLLGGALGKVLHPGDDTNGLFRTIILGILGGVLGNFVAQKFLGWGAMSGIDFRSIGIAAVGSLVLLLIPRLFKKK
ncbi:MAG: GlsB/YeaQ/YmgE family stress response membrane protein [Verrucomicrobia bacterium]|jgi:uncharacterized membrane protein YeaQ/YmgE (transglycosylase-associated protein family)|nr:GlsB/YeaQ/YmgE family stress response membrane protein [Verrucomicrobiota bacterium]